jgi:predicted ATPase
VEGHERLLEADDSGAVTAERLILLELTRLQCLEKIGEIFIERDQKNTLAGLNLRSLLFDRFVSAWAGTGPRAVV